jgi:hypothetical protein
LRLHLAQPLVHRLAQVALLALQLGDLARQLFVAAAQPRHLGARGFELAVDVEQAAAQGLQLLAQLGLACARLFVAGRQPCAQVEDGLACLVIGKQLGMAGRGQQAQAQSDSGTAHVTCLAARRGGSWHVRLRRCR